MFQGITAIAFDIDGTLYASHSLYCRIIPHFLKHLRFYLKYNKVRKLLHHTAPLAHFYEYQARNLARLTGDSSEVAAQKIKSMVYDGMKPYFDKIKCFDYVPEAFQKFKEAGLKVAILSDFPPEQKGEIWGVKQYCDVILGSEEAGALKPSKYPFGILAQKLGVNPEQILYVGNSVKYDVEGAKNAGMKTAYILPWWRRVLGLSLPGADISFSSYRQLVDIVLK